VVGSPGKTRSAGDHCGRLRVTTGRPKSFSLPSIPLPRRHQPELLRRADGKDIVRCRDCGQRGEPGMTEVILGDRPLMFAAAARRKRNIAISSGAFI
jgi:hypothetical protein